MARPKVVLPPIKEVESLAAQGLTEQQIADSLGIHINTLRNRKKDNCEFLEAIKKGKSKGIAVVANALFNKAKNGDTTAMIFYLKNRDPESWGDKQQLDHTSSDGSMSPPKTQLTAEELKDRLKELGHGRESSQLASKELGDT